MLDTPHCCRSTDAPPESSSQQAKAIVAIIRDSEESAATKADLTTLKMELEANLKASLAQMETRLYRALLVQTLTNWRVGRRLAQAPVMGLSRATQADLDGYGTNRGNSRHPAAVLLRQRSRYSSLIFLSRRFPRRIPTSSSRHCRRFRPSTYSRASLGLRRSR